MRKLKTVVKLFTFPAACLACAVWVASFIIIGVRMPHENVGLITLLVFSGLALMFPWMMLVMGALRRIGGGDDPPGESSDTVTKP
jgi:hypothetical protein